MTDFVFIDSGTGGIPYLLHLKNYLPQANCVYVGDTKNFPYGTKSSEEIIKCVTSLVQKIIEKFNPLVIVVACNTMSVNALDSLRKEFPKQYLLILRGGPCAWMWQTLLMLKVRDIL